jgi:MFS family permease
MSMHWLTLSLAFRNVPGTVIGDTSSRARGARMGARHGSPETRGWQVLGVLGRRLARGGDRRERRHLTVWLAWEAFAITGAFTTAGVLLLGFLSDLDSGAGGAEVLQGWLLATLTLPFSFVGALIIARRPGNRIGQLLLCGAMSFAALLAVGGYVYQGWELGRDLPGLAWAAWVSNWVWMPALVASLLLLLLYPNGRLPSRRWRPVAVAVLAWSVLVTLVLVLYPDAVGGGPRPAIGLQGAAGDLLRRFLSSPLTPIPPMAFLIAGALALGLRVRRSRGDERQQVKWLAYAATLVAFMFVLSGLPVTAWLGDVIATLLWLAVWGIPVTIGVAILKYRLYDIDRLISRTLAYAVLTAALGLVYVTGVFVLGRLLDPADGQSELAVAATTLGVAALFQPLRRRVQVAVDRRFNRARYDAAKTVAAFSARLHDQIDLGPLSDELLAVVDQTMQPTTASLWLRPSIRGPRRLEAEYRPESNR